MFKKTILIISAVAVLSTALAIFTIPYPFLFGLNVAVMGFSTIPMTPIAYSFSVELTYPTPEAMSNGMMILPNKVYGTLIGTAASVLCESFPNKSGTLLVSLLFTLNAAICGVSAIFLKEELKRLKFSSLKE